MYFHSVHIRCCESHLFEYIPVHTFQYCWGIYVYTLLSVLYRDSSISHRAICIVWISDEYRCFVCSIPLEEPDHIFIEYSLWLFTEERSCVLEPIGRWNYQLIDYTDFSVWFKLRNYYEVWITFFFLCDTSVRVIDRYE